MKTSYFSNTPSFRSNTVRCRTGVSPSYLYVSPILLVIVIRHIISDTMFRISSRIMWRETQYGRNTFVATLAKQN